METALLTPEVSALSTKVLGPKSPNALNIGIISHNSGFNGSDDEQKSKCKQAALS